MAAKNKKIISTKLLFSIFLTTLVFPVMGRRCRMGQTYHDEESAYEYV